MFRYRFRIRVGKHSSLQVSHRNQGQGCAFKLLAALSALSLGRQKGVGFLGSLEVTRVLESRP